MHVTCVGFDWCGASRRTRRRAKRSTCRTAQESKGSGGISNANKFADANRDLRPTSATEEQEGLTPVGIAWRPHSQTLGNGLTLVLSCRCDFCSFCFCNVPAALDPPSGVLFCVHRPGDVPFSTELEFCFGAEFQPINTIFGRLGGESPRRARLQGWPPAIVKTWGDTPSTSASWSTL